MVCLGPESEQKHQGDAWAESGEHFDIALSFEQTDRQCSHTASSEMV